MPRVDLRKFAKYRYRGSPLDEHYTLNHVSRPLSDDVISGFCGRWAPLDLFWPCAVSLDAIAFPSAGHALYAASVEPSEPRCDYHRHELACTATHQQARAYFKRGRMAVRGDWEVIRDEVCRRLLVAKLQHAQFVTSLRESGAARLVWSNRYGEDYWGVFRGDGQNRLGELLVELRGRLTRSV